MCLVRYYHFHDAYRSTGGKAALLLKKRLSQPPHKPKKNSSSACLPAAQAIFVYAPCNLAHRVPLVLFGVEILDFLTSRFQFPIAALYWFCSSNCLCISSMLRSR